MIGGLIYLQSNLLTLITIRPSVLHLGEMGDLLVTRYLSVHEGFTFLKESDYLNKELARWHEVTQFTRL